MGDRTELDNDLGLAGKSFYVIIRPTFPSLGLTPFPLEASLPHTHSFSPSPQPHQPISPTKLSFTQLFSSPFSPQELCHPLPRVFNILSGNLPCVWNQYLRQRAGGYQRKLTGKVAVGSQHLPMSNLRQEQKASQACSCLAGSVTHPDSQEGISCSFHLFSCPPQKSHFLEHSLQ